MNEPVFISYARSTRAVEAEALHRALDGLAFIDTESIELRAQLPERIVDAMLDAQIVVLFVDEEYFGRWYCLWELEVALTPLLALSLDAPDDSRRQAVEPLVVALPAGRGNLLEHLPPALRNTNVFEGKDTAALAALVRRELEANRGTVGEHLVKAGGSRIQKRQELIELVSSPEPRSLAGFPLLCPRDIPPSLGRSFVGRSNELWRLNHLLRPPGSGRPPGTVVLTGLAGAGKTALSLEFIHRMGPRFFTRGIFRVRADLSDALLEAQFHDVLQTIDPNTPDLKRFKESARDIGKELRDALDRLATQPVLYVIENVPEPKPGTPPRPLETWCPALGKVAVLATSRLQMAGPGQRSLHLLGLNEHSAVALLTEDYEDRSALSDDEWSRIAKWVGHLPLALTLLNRALRMGGLGARELAERANQPYPVRELDRQTEALRPLFPPEQIVGISETLRLSYERLPESAQRAARLLARLGPEPIPRTVVEAFGPELSAPTVIVTLRHRNFITAPVSTGADLYGSMHRLLADFLCEQSPSPKEEMLTVAAVVTRGLEPVPTAVRPGTNPLLPHGEWLVEQLLPTHGPEVLRARILLGLGIASHFHAASSFQRERELGERLLADAEKELGPQDPLTDAARAELAIALRAQGHYADARALLEETLKFRSQHFGDEHPATITGKANLATVLSAQGELRDARSLQEQVLAATRQQLGKDSEEALVAKNNLANTLNEMGNSTEARRLHEEVLAASRSIFGLDHLRTLVSMNNLAPLLRKQGELDRAVALQEEALKGLLRLLGEEHPMVLAAQSNLSSTLVDRSELGRARELQERTLELSRRVLGDTHPDTLKVTMGLSETLREMGDFAGSIQVQMNALTSMMQRLGPEHPQTVAARGNLATTLHGAGEITKARKMQEEVLESSLRLFGEEHEDTLATRENLAGALQQLGDYEGATRLRSKVVEVLRRIAGEDHPRTLLSLANLGSSLLRRGKDERALALLEEGLTKALKKLGESHQTTLQLKNNLAMVFKRRGQNAKALTLQQEVLACFERILPRRHPTLLIAKGNLAGTFHDMRDYSVARKLQEEVLADSLVVLGQDHYDTLGAKDNLAGTLLSQGETAQALHLRQEVVEASHRVLGPSHPQTRIAEQNLQAVIEAIEAKPRSLGRNERCYCGSGKKYKKCHG